MSDSIDLGFKPDPQREVDPDEYPREMTPEEMVHVLGNGIREVMAIDQPCDEQEIFELFLQVSQVATVYSQEQDGYATDLAHAIAGAGRMIDRLNTELQAALDENEKLKADADHYRIHGGHKTATELKMEAQANEQRAEAWSQQQRTLEAQRGELTRMRAEIRAVLRQLGEFEVAVCEGCGPEDLAASLAVSVGKAMTELKKAREDRTELLEILDKLCPAGDVPPHIVQLCGPDCAFLFGLARGVVARHKGEKNDG